MHIIKTCSSKKYRKSLLINISIKKTLVKAFIFVGLKIKQIENKNKTQLHKSFKVDMNHSQ